MKYFELNRACGVDTGPNLFIVTQLKVIEAGTRAWSMSSSWEYASAHSKQARSPALLSLSVMGSRERLSLRRGRGI